MTEPVDWEQPLPEVEKTDIPVRIVGPTDNREQAATAWTVRRFWLSDSAGPIKAVSRNPFRKKLLLIAETNGVLFGSSNEQVRTRDGAGFIPLTAVVPLTHTEEVWVNNNPTETPKVTVIEEMWSS